MYIILNFLFFLQKILIIGLISAKVRQVLLINIILKMYDKKFELVNAAAGRFMASLPTVRVEEFLRAAQSAGSRIVVECCEKAVETSFRSFVCHLPTIYGYGAHCAEVANKALPEIASWSGQALAGVYSMTVNNSREIGILFGIIAVGKLLQETIKAWHNEEEERTALLIIGMAACVHTGLLAVSYANGYKGGAHIVGVIANAWVIGLMLTSGEQIGK